MKDRDVRNELKKEYYGNTIASRSMHVEKAKEIKKGNYVGYCENARAKHSEDSRQRQMWKRDRSLRNRLEPSHQ